MRADELAKAHAEGEIMWKQEAKDSERATKALYDGAEDDVTDDT
jgi:hypothetical protein